VTPSRSYIVWFSQRVGSTLLAQALEDTGVAGRPREWLTDHAGAGLLAMYGVRDAAALRDALWREGTTPNGVFGAKYGPTPAGLAATTALFATLDPTAPWAAVFPRCQHVFMTRRDKLRLAVSWWRAIQSGVWHRPNGEAPPASPLDLVDRYDRIAIDHLIREAGEREAAIHDQLAQWGVVPHTIVYEDLIARFEPTVREVLAFLELPAPAAIPAPAFAPLADAVSETWVERYRSGLA